MLCIITQKSVILKGTFSRSMTDFSSSNTLYIIYINFNGLSHTENFTISIFAEHGLWRSDT
jgi:hypothetical protein